MTGRIDVLHGVNLDMLGRRDPEHYGSLTLTELEVKVKRFADDLGLELAFFQTNHEGALVEYLHRAEGLVDGIVLNAGAWTHYAWALRDALEIADVPTIEVHLSAIEEREEWRRTSIFDGLVLQRISGRGAEGYKEALTALRDHLEEVVPERVPATGTPTGEHLFGPDTPRITDPEQPAEPGLHDQNEGDPAAAPPMPAQDPTPPSLGTASPADPRP
jgi:3-dehydroquinate dehydratase-2